MLLNFKQIKNKRRGKLSIQLVPVAKITYHMLNNLYDMDVVIQFSFYFDFLHNFYITLKIQKKTYRYRKFSKDSTNF